MEIKVIFPSLWNRTPPFFSRWVKAKKTGDLGLEGENQTDVRSSRRGIWSSYRSEQLAEEVFWHWNDCTVCVSVFWSMPVLRPSMLFCWNTVNTRVFFNTFSLNVRSSSIDCCQTHKRVFWFQTWSDALISFTQPEPLWSRTTRLIFSWFIKNLWWAVHRPCLRRSSLLCVSLFIHFPNLPLCSLARVCTLGHGEHLPPCSFIAMQYL